MFFEFQRSNSFVAKLLFSVESERFWKLNAFVISFDFDGLGDLWKSDWAPIRILLTVIFMVWFMIVFIWNVSWSIVEFSTLKSCWEFCDCECWNFDLSSKSFSENSAMNELSRLIVFSFCSIVFFSFLSKFVFFFWSFFENVIWF